MDEILILFLTVEIDPPVKSPSLASAMLSFYLNAILRFQVELKW